MTSGPCSKLCAIMSGVDGSPEVAPAPPLLRSPCMQVTRRQYRRQMQEATARALAETAHLLAQERAAEGVRRVFLRAGLAVCARAHARTTRRCCRPARVQRPHAVAHFIPRLHVFAPLRQLRGGVLVASVQLSWQ